MNTLSTNDAPEVRAGMVLGRYELLLPIAAGGMAQVWAARMKGARQFQKIVAVKTMLPQLSEDAQFEQMFLDEASLASQVRHPNVVAITDLGEQEGVLYLVMEMIEGVPLNHLMKAAKPLGGVPTAIAARIALQACAGLHAAHELKDEKGNPVGLVHRDVSPQNLLVTYGGVTKVVDFGVAKATALGGGATQAGQVKGKVSYMAPEQVSGEGLDRRADVFALGIVLYALTTGKHPFRRESEAATMYNICSNDPVVAPSRVVEGYAAELEPIVLKALEKKRENRYESCDAMLRALSSLPPHLRVSSDADVGDYVEKLLGTKRAEQKKRLAEAIERADAAIESGSTGVSGRFQMSSSTNGGELSGLATGMHPQIARNRILGGAGLVALAVSGGAMAMVVLNQGRDEPVQELQVSEAVKEAKAEEVTAIPLDALSEEPLDPSEEEAAAKAAEEAAEKAAEEEAAAAKKATAPKPKPKPRIQGPRPKPKPSPKPVKTPKPAADWQSESGF